MSDENTYERAVEPERESDYACSACGDYCGETFCGDCRALRTKEWEGLENSTIAILEIAREAHDARWDDDTTQTRKNLAQALLEEFEAMFRIATGNVPS